jgi:hypothetical protein
MSHMIGSLGGGAPESSELWRQRDRPILAYGLMLVAAVSLVLNYFIKFPTWPEEAVARFREYCDNRLPLQIETSDAATLEQYFEADGFPLPVQILDPAAYTLKGGSLQRMRNRKCSWCAYEGPRNRRFVFQSYPGSIGELPGGAEIRQDRGRSFHVYTRYGATAVFWVEGNLCCALISDAPEEETIRLAQASAKRESEGLEQLFTGL